ncbi:MAG TPA: hypothetical protein VL443_22300 [Cyclobacteriaceae bacterium]|nr:hypothetical protein [Cyclobacteriaceae bacterium]
MNKMIVLIIVILLSPIIGGLYGILHDQITYSISEEYYTKYKFYQFGIPDYFRDRFGVSIVGFSATWWMGLPIGIIIGLVGLMQENYKIMIRSTTRAFFIAILIAILTPLIAVSIWFINLWYQQVSFEGYAFGMDAESLYGTVTNPFAFYVVGMIHNFSYLGGLLGLIGGVITQLIIKRKNKPNVGDNF